MPAPDKIYIQPNIEDDNDSIRTWLLSPFNDNSVPYLRKDALLEWAKGQLATCDGAVAMQRAYDKLIDELNSL